MSGKESSSYDPRCTSGTTQGHCSQSLFEKKQPGDLDKSSESDRLIYKSSDKGVYESRYSDSGVWSGSNIHSEEIQEHTLDSPDSAITTDSTCMSTQGHCGQPLFEEKHLGELSAGPDRLIYKSSDKCVYDSRYSDSGVWSGSNIHSEEIHEQTFDSPDSPVTRDSTRTSTLDKVSGDKSSTYMRLDSGIDVSQQLSELNIKCSDSYNDLSVKGVSSKDLSSSTSNITSSTKSSNSPYSVTGLDLLDHHFQQNEDGDTPLHQAIVEGFIETVFSSVRLAPNQNYLDIRNNDRQTPLHLAVLTGQHQLVRLLVCAGAALDEHDRNGNTPLHLAVQDSNLACVVAIIAPVNVPEISQAQLQYTPRFTNRVIANIYNYEGQTPLHLAALSGDLEIFRYLLWAGADINAKEWKGGQTCLHLAVECRNLELCVFLLRQEKINAEEITYAGHTAYQTACSGWDLNIADTLRKHGVDTYESDSDSEDDDDDMLESKYNGLQVNGGGLVDVGA